MTRLLKKDQERWFLDQFREVFAEFPDGEIEGHERPDFLVTRGDTLLGIEVREVFRPGPVHGGSLQAQESLRECLVSRAEELHVACGGPPVHVTVLLGSAVRVDSKELPVSAKVLVELAMSQIPQPGETIRFSECTNPFALPPGLVSMKLWGRHEGSTLWSLSGVTYVPTLDPSDIQQLLDGKEPLVEEYRKAAPEQWLLMVAEGTRTSQMVDLTDETKTHTYVSSFDRAFFFQRHGGAVQELVVETPSSINKTPILSKHHHQK